jgi:hypothetical protein
VGLTLYYELSVPRDTAMTEVVECLRRLHQVAATLPFDAVSSLTITTAGRTLGESMDSNGGMGNWFRYSAHCRLQGYTNREDDSEDLVPDAVGFAVMPGDESESATFGLAWVPPENDEGGVLRDQPYIWHWHSWCKTQYASNLGDDHFVRCHTSLVALLDKARDFGFDVVVRDEGHYWETRDTDVLLAEVRKMNELIAGFAGAVHDSGLRIESPIFQHPEFEVLETRARGDSE